MADEASLPGRPGDCWIERTTLDDGLTVVRSHYQPARDLAEASVQDVAGPTLVITYGLSGESGFVAEDGSSLRFGAGRTTLAAFAHTRGERRFRAQTAVRQLRLVLNGRALERYLGEAAIAHLASRKGIRLLDEHPTTAGCRALLYPLLSPGAATPVDRHIAALTLAAEHLRPLMPASAPASSSLRLSTADIEKLARARDLMQNHMDRALTIPYLSAAVGLNECKFKQGFREIYGTPPHQFLLELRMQHARALLQSGCQVAQAAYAVGYRHPASFSAAFTRHFGHVPKSVGQS
ncbi:MAG: AraC family transcriptional regulator [Zoogloea sp.]|nr:AraC family transcriptional regulator [Zoogloea sp.]